MLSFWERIEFAIRRAFLAGRYLPNPEAQELTIWQDVRRGRKNATLIIMRAEWLQSVGAVLGDERNF